MGAHRYFDPEIGRLARIAHDLGAVMADNSVLPATGDTVRSVQKTTPKSSVVVVDLGGSGTEDLSAFPGSGAARLGKLEDAVAGDGDLGVFTLGIRKDTPTSLVSADADYSGFEVSKLGAQWVVSAAPFAVQQSAGTVTGASTAYTTGDQVGTIGTVANAALASGGGGYIEAAWLNDESAIIGNYRLWIFNATVTLAADNAAFSLSDADAEKLACPPIELGPGLSAANNIVAAWTGAQPYVCAATSLFVACQTLSGHTFFGSTSALKLNLLLSRTPA